jgi:hypothetical protein
MAWGIGSAGLLVGHVRLAAPWPLYAAAAAAAGVAALLVPDAGARRRPAQVVLALGCALLMVGHGRLAPSWDLIAVGGAAAALAVLLLPDPEALARPWLAVLAAGCGLLMARLPEPTFYLLVPVVVAAAWPLRPPRVPESLPRQLPAWAAPASFLLAATGPSAPAPRTSASSTRRTG